MQYTARIGDKFLITPLGKTVGCSAQHGGVAEYVIVKDVDSDGEIIQYTTYDKEGRSLDTCEHCLQIKKGSFIPYSNSNMNFADKFAAFFLSEPEKTFRKAGLTDSDGNLTTLGTKVFLGYMLQKNGADFKATVVDPIIADEEAKAKA